jgi:biopolymer transport protein ExbB
MNSPRPWRALLASATVCCLLVAAQLAQAADATKKKFTFDTTETGSKIGEAVTQLPLLVRLHSGNFTFAQAKPDGADLHFFAADGKTPLASKIENFDAANELANVWVSLPKLTPNAKTDSIVLAWGNDKPAPADGKGLYDAAQVFVYHFGGTEGVKDATANANNARASSATVQAAGPIGAAAAFNGSQRVEIPASATLKLAAGGAFTFTAWVKPTAADDATLFSLGGADKGLSVVLAGGKPAARVGAKGPAVAGSAALKPAVWQHLAVVGSAGKATLYLDGVEVGSGALVLPDLAGEAVIGDGFKGELDEVTLAATNRSPAYVQALAASQMADSPLIALSDEAAEGEGVSYFAILIGSVTIDGWIVIGLLAVMAVVSVYVMVSKSLMLSAAKKANRAFLETFQSNPTDLLTPGHGGIAALEGDARFKPSSLYRLYRTGIAEMQLRADSQAQAGRPFRLTANGLSAIRSSLDATMLREGQRLNSGIVLLTIAISGGPFLGLLGTVVGVMITFAAIAAAGDVNVNAIAPGIAAALVATVAGLAVAIPALFGYNWLASQIKNVSSDLAVYLDEFVTKTAELHAD